MRAEPRASTIGRVSTPIGELSIVEDAAGALRMVEFADKPHRVTRWMRRADVGPIAAGDVSAALTEAFAAYFSGDLTALDSLAVRLEGSAFQNAMWSALRAVVPGSTLSYGAFAAALGRPSAARAVGHANGANPLAIVVPCHRLVAADGSLTDYGGGLERKRWLLDHEARFCGPPASRT